MSGLRRRAGAAFRVAFVSRIFPVGLIAWLAAATIVASTSEPSKLLRLERSLDTMGTTYTVTLYGTDQYRLDSAIDDAFDEAKRLEELLSNYRPESEWSRVNRDASFRFRFPPIPQFYGGTISTRFI